MDTKWKLTNLVQQSY